jgi:NAD(P)-dependent dehydrogenase (short-subunit alcohol dehydrogenase family)
MVSGKSVICLSSQPHPGPLYSQRLRAAKAEVIELELPAEAAPHELDQLLTRVVPESRPIDGLLVVAGAPFERPIRQIRPLDWQRLVFSGPALVTSALRAFGDNLAQRQGAVAITTCTFAFDGFAGHAAEAAMHAATFTLARSASEELYGDGIRINAVSVPMFADDADHLIADDNTVYLLSDAAATVHGEVLAALHETAPHVPNF